MNAHVLPAASRRELLVQTLNAVRQAPTASSHRNRDFGIGYGRSSGYGRAARYVDSSPAPRFRLA
ncbi:hypothetical protein [Luteimonas sp. MHLX1A]|uniref:hypothetical protein n=1 Tax=Alterluteimonas muca TaxID=2878684 RepID=UPI001E4D811B|nr:hypothetical protein [Luteimonas sp. MHLX1A]MCD9045194.1 hypothetical protein [Luteimonas sp. MHLX1A]